MEIDLLYFRDCPHRTLAREHLDVALTRTQRTAVIREHEVDSREEAALVGMRGSPTILIEGRDPFADSAGAAELACRLYRTTAGSSGAPTVDQIVEALGG
jgi:hypothetical protein